MVNRTFVSISLLVLLMGLGLATIAGTVSATPQQVDSCQTLDQSGTYVLSSDIETSQDRCFDATADGVVLDGKGHTITSSDGNGTAAIVAVGEDSTVRDLTVADWKFGVIASGSGSTITGVTGRSLDSAVATATQESSITIHDVDGRDVGEVVLVDHATEVSVSEVTGSAVQNAVVEVRRGGGVTVSDVDGSGGDKAGVYVQGSAEVTIDAVRVRDAFVGVSVITTNGATVTDVTAENTTAGVQFATSRNVTLADASIRGPAVDGISVTNTTNTELRNVEIEGADDDGIVVGGGESLTVHNVSTTAVDAGLAVLGTGSVRVDGLTVGNGTDAVVVRNTTGTTVSGLDVEGVTRAAIQVNDSAGTTVRHLTATAVPTALQLRNVTDTYVTGGTYTGVGHLVESTDSANVTLESLRVSNRLVSLVGASFSVAVDEDPPDGGNLVVVPPMLNVTDVGDAPVGVTVDLNTDREYNSSDLGLYRYDGSWTRLDDSVDATVPLVSADISSPGRVAVMTTQSVPSYNSPTPTATETRTPPGRTDSSGSSPANTSQGPETPQADGAGFTVPTALIAVCIGVLVARRHFGGSPP